MLSPLFFMICTRVSAANRVAILGWVRLCRTAGNDPSVHYLIITSKCEFLTLTAPKKREPCRNLCNTRSTAAKQTNHHPHLGDTKLRCRAPFTNAHNLTAVTNKYLELGEFQTTLTLGHLPGHRTVRSANFDTDQSKLLYSCGRDITNWF